MDWTNYVAKKMHYCISLQNAFWKCSVEDVCIVFTKVFFWITKWIFSTKWFLNIPFHDSQDLDWFPLLELGLGIGTDFPICFHSDSQGWFDLIWFNSLQIWFESMPETRNGYLHRFPNLVQFLIQFVSNMICFDTRV